MSVPYPPDPDGQQGPVGPQGGQQAGQQPPDYGQVPPQGQPPGYPPPGYGPPPGYPPPGYGQPPGYGPPPGHRQPPGYGPPAGPDATQQYPSQQYPYDQGQTQQQPYGQPPGGPPPEPAKRSKLPWILTGVGVLIVIAIAAGLYFFVAPTVLPTASSGSSAQGTAQALVDTINSGPSFFSDNTRLDPLLCQQSRDALKQARDQLAQLERLGGTGGLDAIKDIKATARLGAVTQIDADHAKAEVTIAFSNVPPQLVEFGFPTETADTVDLIKENGRWVACDLSVTA